MSNTEKKEGLHFIVGAPRSGTYLLVTKLAENLPVAIPVETHFLPLFDRYLFLWGDLSKRSNREHLLECIYDFLEIWTRRSERGREFKKIRQFSLLCTRNSAAQIIDNSGSYGEMVSCLYACYAKKHGALVACDKSAFYNPVNLDNMALHLPNAKFIHIVRDGRDVSISWRNIWTGPLSVTESAWLWRDHVRIKRIWGKHNPDKYHEIRYEDFIDEPNKEIEKIAEFIGVKSSNRQESKDEYAKLLAEGDTHQLLAGPIDSENKNKWTKLMTRKEQLLFEYWAGDTLREIGYQTASSQYGFIACMYYRLLACIVVLTKPFVWRQVRLFIKNILPLLLWLCSYLNIPLAKLANYRYDHKTTMN